MFDGVCGQVHLQAGSICVSTVTILALVRLVFIVLPTVRLWDERGERKLVLMLNNPKHYRLCHQLSSKENTCDFIYL